MQNKGMCSFPQNLPLSTEKTLVMNAKYKPNRKKNILYLTNQFAFR